MLQEFKKKQILGKIISKVKDFVNPAGASGKKGAEFATQVMKHDELVKKLTPAKKIYSDKMIEKEADQIFTKLNPQYKLKDGTFPRAYGPDASSRYNRDYNRTYKQVKDTRRAQSK